MTRTDSAGDISGGIEIRLGGTFVAAILVDSDPVRLRFFGGRHAGTVEPETFLAWLDSPVPEPFYIQGWEAARLQEGRVVFSKGPLRRVSEPLPQFRTGFAASIGEAHRWRETGWPPLKGENSD